MLNILKWSYLCYRPANAINAMFQSSMGLSEMADLMAKLLVSKILDGSGQPLSILGTLRLP